MSLEESGKVRQLLFHFEFLLLFVELFVCLFVCLSLRAISLKICLSHPYYLSRSLVGPFRLSRTPTGEVVRRRFLLGWLTCDVPMVCTWWYAERRHVHIHIAWHSCTNYVTLYTGSMVWCYGVKNPSFSYRYQRMHWIWGLRKPVHHQWRTSRAQSSMSRKGHVLEHHWVVPLQVQAGLPWRWEVMFVWEIPNGRCSVQK